MQGLSEGDRAVATFAAKGHDLFATLHGRLVSTTTAPRSTGCGTASWRRGSKAARTIPSSLCCGSTPRTRRSGSTQSSFLAGIKMLLGADPKEDYKDKVAEVELR